MVKIIQLLIVCGLVFSSTTTFANASNSSSNTDVSELLRIEKSGFRKDFITGEIVHVLSITNISTNEIRGPLELEFRDLHSKVSVVDSMIKKAAANNKLTSKRLLILLAEETDALKPGETEKLIIRFRAPEGLPVSYTPIISIIK